MKKICILMAILGICNAASALTATGTPATLYGNNAYTYGFQTGVTSGQQITSATITWNNITLTSPRTGTMYTDLIKSSTQGWSTPYNDGDAPGDYFASYASGTRTLIGTKSFTRGVTTTLSYTLTSAQLIVLNSYVLSNPLGVVNFGFDPDCTYTVGSLVFNFTVTSTTPPSVPDGAATALLVIAGLASVELFRRKFAPAH